MSTTENAALLRNYAETGSDQAFGQLVSRHFDLVYSAALRIGRGDAHLAQDVAQTVFTDLARKAGSLAADTVLGGWLYRHACFTAAKAIRTERRRQARERLAVEMNAQNDPSDAVWRQLAPLLDEAMGRLNATDRDAIVLRFFERQPFRVVGGALGTSEEGARKRVDRALEKLRGSFGRRGVSISALALAESLGSQAVTMAPVGMASMVAMASMGGAGAGAAFPLTKILFVMTKLKIAAVVIAAGMGAVIIMQSQTSAKLREENRVLREQAAQLDQLRAENERLAQAKADAPKTPAEDQLRELMRLRGEVGGLKRQLAEAAKAREKTARTAQAQADADTEAEQQKQELIAKMNYTKGWSLAFFMYADKNNGQFPTNFDQALPFLPDETKGLTNLGPEQFQIAYQGSLASVTNPGNTIVVMEKEPVQTSDGGWIKAYGFADGHSEIHKGPPDGNFQPWESQHLQLPPAQ